MKKPPSRILLIALVTYTAASALHFTHNAVFLASYPNMPDWISRVEVFGALGALIAVGVLGYLVFFLGYRVVGLVIMGVYAGFGYDGLAHYSLAPVSAHTISMNLTIWLEVATATLLLVFVVVHLARQTSAGAAENP